MLVSLGKSTSNESANAKLIVPSFPPRLEGDARVSGEVHDIVRNESANKKIKLFHPSPLALKVMLVSLRKSMASYQMNPLTEN